MTPQELLSLGFHILPLKPNSKDPQINGGVYAATDDLITVERWQRQFPNCNWGVRTGKASGVIVLDVDAKNGGYESLAELLKEVQLPPTLTVKTANGGLHYYFRAPEDPIDRNLGFMPGLDLMAEKAYVVAPGSSLGVGRNYEVLER